MREIKYRAWDINNKKIYYGSMSSMGRLTWGKDYCNPPSGQQYIIEQYTGLTDKNGKEIYEGDRVRFEAMGEWGEGCIEHFLHVFHVMWDKNNFKEHDMFTSIKYLGCPKEIEVIGNIHD